MIKATTELKEELREENDMGIFNIPDKVRIDTKDYLVEIQEDTPIVIDGVECYGSVSYEDLVIKINSNRAARQHVETTFLHEAIHAMIFERGLEIENEEEVVKELSKVLFQFIRDNKNIFIKEE